MHPQLDQWRQQIAALSSFAAERLTQESDAFLASEHAEQAVSLGWTELELFGLYRGELSVAPRRADTQGLVPGLVIANVFTLTIIAIEAQRAVLQTSSGSTLHHRRILPCPELALPFWEHPAYRDRAP